MVTTPEPYRFSPLERLDLWPSTMLLDQLERLAIAAVEDPHLTADPGLRSMIWAIRAELERRMDTDYRP